MNSYNQNSQMLFTIRQKSQLLDIESFILDFLNIWEYIHSNGDKYTLEASIDFSKSIFNSHILPFYNKYKDKEFMDLYEGWITSYSSITLKWDKRGSILFPLQLITYEISYHDENLINFFLKGLLTKEIKGNIDALFEYLFPVLINFTAPLDELDILLLKGFQNLEGNFSAFGQHPTQKDLADYLKVSTRTVIRRMNIIRFLQMVQSIHFIDMGSLGYETLLFIHNNPFPDEFKMYLLLSTNLTIGYFSVVQIPYKKSKILMKLQEQLDILVYYNMDIRASSWNLNGLTAGKIKWGILPPFMYNNINVPLIKSNPRLTFQLKPKFDTFRELTPADIKILDFLVIKGSFRSTNQLSQAIKVSSPEISQRIQEYSNKNLVLKMHQYFNIGLDISIFFFISTEDNSISWLQHFLSFPKVDLFYQNKKKPYYYFGYLKIPSKWIKTFTRKVDLIKRDYDIKFYYKIASSVDYFKWGVSIGETYF